MHDMVYKKHILHLTRMREMCYVIICHETYAFAFIDNIVCARAAHVMIVTLTLRKTHVLAKAYQDHRRRVDFYAALRRPIGELW